MFYFSTLKDSKLSMKFMALLKSFLLQVVISVGSHLGLCGNLAK